MRRKYSPEATLLGTDKVALVILPEQSRVPKEPTKVTKLAGPLTRSIVTVWPAEPKAAQFPVQPIKA